MTKHIFSSKDNKVTVSFDPSLLGDGDSEPNIGQRINQWIKRIGGTIVVLLVIWAVMGTPYMRWDETLIDGKDGTDLQETDLAFTRYISIGDSRRVHAGEYGDGLPWLIFIPHGDSPNGAAGDDDVFPAPENTSF